MRALLALALFAGCRAGAPAEPAERAPDFLVWTAATDRPETRWLDAGGTELGRARGIHVAAGDTVWRLDRRMHTVATMGCREDDAGTMVPGRAELTDLAARSADGRTSLVMVQGEARVLPGYESYVHRVAVRASLGPLVFGEERADQYACGAHGGVEAAAFTFDLEARVHQPIAPRPAPGPLGPKIRAAFEREAIEGLAIDSPARVAATVPRWIDGALTARHLAFVDTCYACSNGAWSSYTSAVWIDDVRIPDEWAIATEVTPAIAAAISGPEAVPSGVSWGTPDAAWRRVFATTPPR